MAQAPADTTQHARERLAADYLRGDENAVAEALAAIESRCAPPSVLEPAAGALIERVRARSDGGPVAALLSEYGLATREGVALMCLAEALARIPDRATADRLIHDLLAGGDWSSHRGQSPSRRVNAATVALLLSGRVEALAAGGERPGGLLGRLVGGIGEGAVRAGLRRAVARLADAFVFAPDIATALGRAAQQTGGAWSFDLLGEAALTATEAQEYLAAYHAAVAALAAAPPPGGGALSVKLSALHPRYEEAQRERVLREVPPRLIALAHAARAAGVSLTLDAEEARRLELMLDVYAAVLTDPSLAGWSGFGLAVQAYQKRAPAVIDYLTELAHQHDAPLPVRLVKGAYWDSEIKRAQALGLDDYPVYTRKAATDVAYLHCATRLLDAEPRLQPRFATHNAHTLVALRTLADGRALRCERLHGMGEALYAVLMDEDPAVECRVYAPVGPHEALLPYLVRRLLENGANTSFVHHLHDPREDPARLARDPRRALADGRVRGAHLPLPPDIYPERRGALGFDCEHPATREALAGAMRAAAGVPRVAAPAEDMVSAATPALPVTAPARPGAVLGTVRPVHPALVERAVERARAAQAAWAARPVAERAACLDTLAGRYEAERGTLLHLLVNEAGRTLPAALAELREAADFCRYYAAEARRLFTPRHLDCPAGEDNLYQVHPRGIAACISPWNFPLAIFTGQVVAGLVTGNAVLAKPAPQTPLVAAAAVHLMHESGIPAEVAQLLPGADAVGAALAAHPGVDVVAFTGSLMAARAIQAALAQRPGLAPAFIAETGSINAMVVDASALPDQVVPDVLRSGFDSAGQRCSALRVLCVQAEAADTLLRKLAGAVAQLRLGDPADWSTDVGPLIDAAAAERLAPHLERLRREARLIAIARPPAGDAGGHFLPPQVWEIPTADWLREETFGPIVHVVRYREAELSGLLAALATSGYGLTLGVHSRVPSRIQEILDAVPAGNAYVNRDMIGAVVGTQPFGGERLSGTGPKAGGPLYLTRFVHKRTVSTNTAAVGGNASLYSRED